jgi:hypothetical protein
MGRICYVSSLAICLVASLDSSYTLGQAGSTSRNTPVLPSKSIDAKQVISPNVALYAFLRVAAADNLSSSTDRARSKFLIAQAGLSSKDSVTLQSVFQEYATALRELHEPKLPNVRLSASALQQGEIRLYARVIRRLRAELSPEGLVSFRHYIELKKQKMELHLGVKK